MNTNKGRTFILTMKLGGVPVSRQISGSSIRTWKIRCSNFITFEIGGEEVVAALQITGALQYVDMRQMLCLWMLRVGSIPWLGCSWRDGGDN